MLTYHVFRPGEGQNAAGSALACMLSDESPGKSYAEVMRLRVAGALAGACTDTYFVALDGDACISRLWNGWGKHKDAIGNFGNFLTLEQYRGQGIGTRLLEMWYADLQARDDKPLALFCTSAPKAAPMYAKYGMRPIDPSATHGPSFMPLGDSPDTFDAFCKAYYRPAQMLVAKPAGFEYRHEIDLLLKFALLQSDLPFGFEGMPSLEQALLTAPEKTALYFTDNGRCVGWRYDGKAQIYPKYTKTEIIEYEVL
ncbi:MAG: GNAT family N-acetyltransferase [Clostridia bacterium]|nr:GNAT family N-acetyltransferase [Clostridia bacterium]